MKKIISVFLSICICLCLFTPVCFADDSVYDHTHNWVKEKIHSYSLEYNGVAFGIDVFKCSECALYLHTLKFLGYEVPVIRASPDTALGSEAAAMCAQAMVAIFGKEWYATKFEAGGGSASPGGVGRNPSGYAGEGVPSVDSLGTLHIVVKPVFMVDKFGFSWTGMNIFKNYTFNEKEYYQCGTTGIVHGEILINKLGTSMVSPSYVWTFEVPYSGIYYINANEESQNLGSYFLKSCNSKRNDITINVSTYHSDDTANKYWMKSYANKGDVLSFYYCNYDTYLYAYTSWINYIQYSCNPLIVSFEPEEQYVSSVNNITINNNTFNGNIYVDNTNKLTYIYPQYTVNNETKISNNPIIYNEETKQYYTYDQTTNNYYYITYGDSAPTPTPSPSPDPGGSTPDPGKPTPTPTPGGSDSSGDGSSGNPFKWLGELFKDILDGIIKGLWKIITSIFGFILWLISLLFKLFPWMPNSALVALCGGVVVVTIIRIIKFITGR